MVVGELRGAGNHRYLFITNASPHKAVAVRITLADGLKVAGEIPRTAGPLKKVAARGRPPVMEVDLAPGDGRLFRVR